MAFFNNSIPHRLSKLLVWDQVSVCFVHTICPAAPDLLNSVSLSIDHSVLHLHYAYKLQMISPLDCSQEDKVHFLTMTNQVHGP